MLRPVANYFSARMTMWERLLAGKDKSSWLAMNKWANDPIPMPGAAYKQWVRDFYQENKLVKGEIRGDEPVLVRVHDLVDRVQPTR